MELIWKIIIGKSNEEQVMPWVTPNGTKGEIIGKIIEKDGSIITVNNEKVELMLMPYCHRGIILDDYDFDKDMVKKMEGFKVGDQVKVTWLMEGHYRIVNIEYVEKDERP